MRWSVVANSCRLRCLTHGFGGPILDRVRKSWKKSWKCRHMKFNSAFPDGTPINSFAAQTFQYLRQRPVNYYPGFQASDLAIGWLHHFIL